MELHLKAGPKQPGLLFDESTPRNLHNAGFKQKVPFFVLIVKLNGKCCYQSSFCTYGEYAVYTTNKIPEALLILFLIMNDDHDKDYEHHLHTSRQSSSQTKSYLHVIV